MSLGGELSPEQRERVELRLEPRASDFSDVELPPLPEVPGMTRNAERRFYYWLTSRGFAGAGSVVELGPWLGRSSLHLAAGLRDAGFTEHLHCVDRFVWSATFGRKSGLSLAPGDDFQPVFEEHVRPIYPKLRVTRSDLESLTWDGGPVEILILDAPKRLDAISSTLATFGPHLVPGVSLVVMQDYLHFPSYALAAVAARLRDHLELVHVVEGCSTVSFVVRKPLDFAESQPVDWNFHHWDVDEALELWEGVLAPLAPEARARIEPGIAMLLLDAGHTAAAVRTIRRMEMAPKTRRRWERFASTTLYERYAPLFLAQGMRRPGGVARWLLRSAARSARRSLRRTASALRHRSP